MALSAWYDEYDGPRLELYLPKASTIWAIIAASRSSMLAMSSLPESISTSAARSASMSWLGKASGSASSPPPSSSDTTVRAPSAAGNHRSNIAS